jgi:uncharacterized protein
MQAEGAGDGGPTGPGGEPADGLAALAIMCKAPRPGRSKTRLAGLIGPEHAAGLAACFLADVGDTVAAVALGRRARGYGLYAPADGAAEIRALLPDGFGLALQEGDDLGVALRGGARRLLAERRSRSAILINADSPTLPPRLLELAVDALDRPGHRVVLGPAIDGGYVMIGVKADHPELFADVPWSTPAVFEVTARRGRSLGLDLEILPTWYDVDDGATLKTLSEELAGSVPSFAAPGLAAGEARRTRAYLAAHGLGRLPLGA